MLCHLVLRLIVYYQYIHVLQFLAGAKLLCPYPWLVPARSKFSKARIPKEVRCEAKVLTAHISPLKFSGCKQMTSDFSSQLFAERSKEHDKYGGDPDQPHKLHIVTRVRSVMRRPYWEKEAVKYLGLQKVRGFFCIQSPQHVCNAKKLTEDKCRTGQIVCMTP